MTRFMGCMAVVAALALAAPAAAQPPWIEHDGGGAGALEMLRMWRLVDKLELDEAQAAKVFPAVRRHREAHRVLTAELDEALAGLRRLLAADADADDLQVTMAHVREVQVRLHEAEVTHEQELAALLRPEQQARLLLFELTFRDDLREMVRRMRGPAGPEGASGPEGGPMRGLRGR